MRVEAGSLGRGGGQESTTEVVAAVVHRFDQRQDLDKSLAERLRFIPLPAHFARAMGKRTKVRAP